MKKIYSFLLAVITTQFLIGQIAVTDKKAWPALSNSPNYYQVRENYLNYLNSLDVESDLLGIEVYSDDLRTKFMRWDYLMKTRVDENGNYPKPGLLFTEQNNYLKAHPDAYTAGSRTALWEPVGTADVPGSAGGAGRVNVIMLDPVEPNTMYAGTAGGGLWKSPDLGGTWLPLTDNIPVTSIADVAVDPSNNDIIYIATGDGYGYEASWQADADFWGGVYSAGIFKSNDGGLTWLPTGLSYLQQDLIIVQRLIVHPENTNILLAATRNGMYRTTDGGDNWTLVSDVHCYDFAFNTLDNNTIYAVGEKDVLVTYDAGENWSMLKNELYGSTDRMSIETTPDNPLAIYVFGPSATMKKSVDGGSTWTTPTSPGGVNTYYGYYDNVLGVSPLDQDLLFTGGLDIARSTNGSSSWSKKSDWAGWGGSDYVHADMKGFICSAVDANIVYACNDGGVFKSTDKGQTWSDISDGLRIAQVYRISSSYTEPDLLLGGWQDNGCNLWNGSDWDRVQGGDGMEVIIDHSNADRMYACYQYGYVTRSINGGVSFADLPVAGGGWVTPYEMDPIDHLVMYYGASSGNIQKSTNGGTSWTTYSANLGGEVFDIEIARSNTNYVYACALQKIKVSTDGGVSWTTITAGLPTGGIGFNYIAVSDENPEHVWVALSGYDDGNKVYFSNNAGATWINVSGTLPNVPVNTIIYENVSTTNRLYVGTDLGVFTKDDVAGDWEPYMTGLPNVMVHELEINYNEFKIYAATYGRNVWKSDLYDYVAPSLTINVIETTYCPDEDLNVSYSASGIFEAGNIFTIELSDADGSFAAPIAIGSVTSTDLTGVIACTIPATTDNGSGYRMRAVSTLIEFTGTNNGTDITITCSKPATITTGLVTPTTAALSWEASVCGISYEIQYKPVAVPTWIIETSTTPFITLTDLNANTLYEWAVSTICVESPLVQTVFTSSEEFATAQNSIEEIAGLSALNIFPNPLTVNATIEFALAASASIKIELLDITGQSVRVINDGELNAGMHSFIIERAGLSRGVYSIQFSNGENTTAKNIVVE